MHLHAAQQDPFRQFETRSRNQLWSLLAVLSAIATIYLLATFALLCQTTSPVGSVARDPVSIVIGLDDLMLPRLGLAFVF